MNGKLFKVLIQKHMKRVQNLVHHENFVLHIWEIVLNRKHIQRTMCMSVMLENFSIKLF
jgi:hypothetical protein